MTRKVDSLSPFHGSLKYEGKYRDADLGTLLFYLRGKPDTPGWRDLFAENNHGVVEYNGRIFPDWAVADARVLFQEDAQTVIDWLTRFGINQEDIPPLT